MMAIDVLPTAGTGTVFDAFHDVLLRGASAHACFW
jgi:hypothetical protein